MLKFWAAFKRILDESFLCIHSAASYHLSRCRVLIIGLRIPDHIALDVTGVNGFHGVAEISVREKNSVQCELFLLVSIICFHVQWQINIGFLSLR